MWHLVNQVYKPKGLICCALEGPALDGMLRAALPEFAIVSTVKAPLSATPAQFAEARQVAKVANDVPLYIVGWSAGCQWVRACLIAGIGISGAACFDGTSANFPEPAPWQIKVWTDAVAHARAGGLNLILTCTEMTYEEKLPASERYMATSHVLEEALGVTLDEDKPIDEPNLYVRKYHSADIDKDAHIRQVQVVEPLLLQRWRATPGVALKGSILTADVTDDDVQASSPIPDEKEGSPAGLSALSIAKAELAKGVVESPAGSNRGPEVDRYFLEPKFFRGDQRIHTLGTAWCAAAACWCQKEGDFVFRVSGIELENDAKKEGRTINYPRPGDLAIFPRGAAGSWERHVTRVSRVGEGCYWTIGGNEEDTWKETQRALRDPVTFVKV